MSRRSRSLSRGQSRKHEKGVVLPVVLLIAMMLLATSAAWLDTSIASARGALNLRDHLRAFHAADAALTRCARDVVAGAIGAQTAAAASSSEPVGWKSEAVFEARAITPFAQWPGAARAPQCVVEAWRIASRPDASAFVLTARGFGRLRETQVLAQLQLVIGGNGAIVERHWRRVVARRF